MMFFVNRFVAGIFLGGLLCVAGPVFGSEISVAGKCNSGAEVVLTLEAPELVVMKPVKAKLQLVDDKGGPIGSALVYCSLYMPDFATGSNNPKLKPADQKGVYSGVMFFSHEGKWNIDLTINFPDGTYEEITLDIADVLPSKS